MDLDFLFSDLPTGNVEMIEYLLVPPGNCKTIAEVRAAIDTLDAQIITLLGKRMRYIEAAGRIKTHRGAVRDEIRKAEVIERVIRMAEEGGFPSKLARQLYELLIEGSIEHEFDVFDRR